MRATSFRNPKDNMNRREKQKKARRLRHSHLEERAWELVARKLDHIGRGDVFRSLNETAKRALTSHIPPPPELRADPLSGLTTRDRDIVIEALSAVTVRVGPNPVPWIDAYTTLLPLEPHLMRFRATTGRTQSRNSPRNPAASNRRSEQNDCVMEKTLCNALASLTGRFSELDRKIFWYRQEPRPGRRMRITLGLQKSEWVDATIDGKPRRAYRCGGCWGNQGFRWADCSSQEFGGSESAPIPVYIQKHALDRLHERLPLDRGRVHLSLLHSIEKAVVAHRDADSSFIEFRLDDELRMGYLVARPIPGAVILTTFLLLTMQGTPEASRLYEALRLQRPDIEYTGLDKLISFVNSDLHADPELAPIFEASGCSHLLALRGEIGPAHRPISSQFLRQYLGRPPRGELMIPNDPVSECTSG